MSQIINRRTFMKVFAYVVSVIYLPFANKAHSIPRKDENIIDSCDKSGPHECDRGTDVFVAKGGMPDENMTRLLAAMGGIESLIGKYDIVVLKPNAQWWNQGMTNTDSMKSFIDQVLSIEGFEGEVIIAENQHYKPLESRGWITDHRNGRWNLSELVNFFNDAGYPNVTKYFWQDGGPNPNPLEGNDGDGTIVNGPEDGDGYVWCDDIVYTSPEGRKCMMTYPIFTSEYSGITVDLKNGAWRNGKYIKTPVNFVNFSALNHHGSYAGATASVKNLMGVVDMTCGFQGVIPQNYYNTHFIGSDSFVREQQKNVRKVLQKIGISNKSLHWRLSQLGKFNFQYTGGCLGYWMRHIRKPDLNIIAAHWVGWGSRTDKNKSSYPKCLIASQNPVALDYYSIKEVLLKETKLHSDSDYYKVKNDPDNENEPLYNFLREAGKEAGLRYNNLSVNLVN